jgi:glutaminase
MAATLANRGVNPLTGEQAIRGEYVESVLSVMGSCGMYDYAGEWLYRVGMPAKSGVSGGVIAVLPGQLGIGVFSPRLDARCNSVRGLRVCDDLSRSFDLHLFNNPHASRSVIRLRFTGADVSSNRVRTAEERHTLRAHGNRIHVYQLQGVLAVSTAEVVLHEVITTLAETDAVIFDLKHVLSINESASRLFHQLVLKLQAQGRPALFTNPTGAPQLRRYMKLKLKEQFDALFLSFPDNDAALEWCENRLLAEKLPVRVATRPPPPAGYELFAGLKPGDVDVLSALLERRHYRQGQVIVELGAPAGELFFLASGCASVTVPVAGGAQKRLATFSAGMAFGEMALLDRAPRSAAVTADTDVECDLLKLEDFERLGETHPHIKIVLLGNLALGLSRKLRKANREISVFEY